MPPGIPRGAMCVQRFDDSLNSAIHITYRISLRSSSMPEPRDPLLKVFTIVLVDSDDTDEQGWIRAMDGHNPRRRWPFARTRGHRPSRGGADAPGPPKQQRSVNTGGRNGTEPAGLSPKENWLLSGNDPSAGSPTETLLRLLLPLNDQV